MSNRTLREKILDLPLYQRWVLILGSLVVGIYIVYEIIFWSFFGEIKHLVAEQNAAVEKRSADIQMQAKDIQNQMKSGIEETHKLIQNQVSQANQFQQKFNSEYQEKQNDFAQQWNENLKTPEERDMDDRDKHLQRQENDVRQGVDMRKDGSTDTVALQSSDIDLLKEMIGEYKKAHPSINKGPVSNTSVVVQLSPEDRIALLEMIRNYNKQKYEQEKTQTAQNTPSDNQNTPSTVSSLSSNSNSLVKK